MDRDDFRFAVSLVPWAVLAAATLALVAWVVYVGSSEQAIAQPAGQSPANVPSVNHSIKIATGNTFQAITLPANRRSLTIQNNNSTDNCQLEVTGLVTAGSTTSSTFTVDGTSVTAAQASIILGAGGSYQRYTPYIPSGTIVATCVTTGDSLYVDVQ